MTLEILFVGILYYVSYKQSTIQHVNFIQQMICKFILQNEIFSAIRILCLLKIGDMFNKIK